MAGIFNNGLNLSTNVFIGSVKTRVFTSSTTYVPTANAIYFIVEIVGGGGSGGAVPSTSLTTAAASGGGGAAYCLKYYTSDEMGVNASIIIGDGGAAAASGNNNGNAGSQTSFNPAGTGVTIFAAAGGGGLSMAATTSPTVVGGGLGGVASGGDINIDGANAGNGYTQGPTSGVVIASAGGESQFGRGGPLNSSVNNSSSGNPPTGYGSGSCGAYGINSATAQPSFAGMPGICIVTEFIAAV